VDMLSAKFDIASGDNPRNGTTRIGVIEFWATGNRHPYKRESSVSVELGHYNNKSDLINKIRALQFRRGTATYIEAGLERLLETKQFGVNITSGRQRIAILVSDGMQESTLLDAKQSRKPMIEYADQLKEKVKAKVFAIGIGNVNRTNLNIIASSKNNVFAIKQAEHSNEVLIRFYNRLVTQICPEAPTSSVPSKFDWCMLECEEG